MASQDSWARPLAKQLVDLFKVASCDYVRRVGTYDPTTGQVVETETVYSGVGAVERTTQLEDGGASGRVALTLWLALEDIGDIWPTTADLIRYDGYNWKIGYHSIANSNTQFSGDVKYAVKVIARRG
jgi:hypothetical protein